MSLHVFSRFIALAVGALVAASPSGTLAAVAGGKPISLIVSYPVGGGADLMARLIAPRMAEALGQTVIVDNKPGAGGQVAGGYVAKAAPDGTTLLVDASSYAVTPSLFPRMAYDPAKAFTPIAVLALFPNVLVAHPPFAAASVRDVVAAAKAKPGTLAFASSGNGSAQHLAGALFEDLAHVDMLHVPYRGGGPAMSDVIGGQVPLFFANLASSLSHIEGGRLRPLAVTSKKRSAALPAVPTMEEAGVPGYEVYEWNPVLAPSGIDAETRRQLIAAVAHAMAAPEVRERIRALGGEPFNGGAAEADAFLREQQQLWGRIVRQRNVKVE
ncbi:tripartite tricarboxylate transporter substrate binding protein [Ideonella sp. YS5]|uniref:tripartite tricarboxylate transporter substrate binding protein n=1 Tax=Ideonella sp. YS5 TaxID=3453714 RepID=UPI003EEB10DE